MQILEEKRQEGEIRVLPESADDLWELSHLLAEGDSVCARTERKVSVGADRSKQVRKPMTLRITVTGVVFEHNTLRVQGTITEGPEEFISFGDHHSITVGVRTELTITKKWDTLSRERLEKTTKETPQNVLLVTFDREEAHIASLTKRGYIELQELKGNVAKKAPGGGSEDFWKTIADAIVSLDTEKNYTTIIVASPAFWTDYLLKAIPASLKKKVTTTSCSSVGKAALSEVVRRPEVAAVLAQDKISQEKQVLQDVLTAIANDAACYGKDECVEKISVGQVKMLLVSMTLIDASREQGWYDELDSYLEQAKNTQADVYIVEHVVQQLDAIGGIAGVLRW